MEEKKRYRNKTIHVRVTEEENKAIEEKMVLAKMYNKNSFMRKMALDGFVINVDISDLAEAVRLLRTVSNNVNQIAKHANETGAIYKSDIEEIKANYESIIESIRESLENINKMTKV